MSAIHGGDVYSREVKLDFSANLNPLGIPEAVRAAAAGADFTHYPDTRCMALVHALSAYEGVPAENIVCGNGAADVIYRIVGALRPKRALLCAPTFSEYEKALVERDCAVSYHILREEDGFALSENILPEISAGVDMLFLCSPNNPVGNVIEPRLLERIIGKCRECGVIIVVDECFLDFTANGFSAKNCLFPNVIVIKAFTKICAMAGLRLGYALFGDERCAHSVRECGQPWSVSAPAQAAGVAAARVLSETDFLARTRALIAEERDFLEGELARLGFEVFPSSANFLLFKGAENLAAALLERGIAIRSCRDYRGLDEHFFRIAVRTHEENERLTKALSDIQKNRP